MKALTLMAAVVFAVGACSSAGAASSAATSAAPGTVADAALVWCMKPSSTRDIGQAAVALGVARNLEFYSDWASSGVMFDDRRSLGKLLEDMATGQMAESSVYQHGQFLKAWQSLSPDTFARTCEAAFAAR